MIINSTLAQEYIPVTVNIPASGEYTYSLTNSSSVEELEGVYLIDYTTNTVTNLIERDYTFAAEAGNFTNRFAINAIVGERNIPSGLENGELLNGDASLNGVQKVLYKDHLYIIRGGKIYGVDGAIVK